MGETKIILEAHNNSLTIKFHVINDHTNIPFDGLIGDCFFREQESKIDYGKSKNKLKSFPFDISLYHNTPQNTANYTLSINSRTETIVSIKIKNSLNLKEGIITAQKSSTLLHIIGNNDAPFVSLRFKRYFINGVCYAFNWLFGIPDAEDAKYYTTSINNLLIDNK